VPEYCKECQAELGPRVKTGLCRKCYNRASTRAWYIANPDKVKAHQAKRCPKEACRRSREWYLNNKGRAKDTALKKDYGITLDDWNRMFEAQNGCCAICGQHQSDLSRTLCVDHNHETGKVRGLLCGTCNRSIGLLKDDKDILRSAISYLEKHEDE